MIQGILSGNGPDLCLHMQRTAPVNYAMRGALYDLTKFKDYSEVIKRFNRTATVPYQYRDGVYALPDTQSFYLMFARDDVLMKRKLRSCTNLLSTLHSSLSTLNLEVCP